MEILGEEFVELVDSLHAQLRDLQAGEPVPRVVLLEAPSGSGKSRIVRELYERLRAGQPVNADGEGYWPVLEDSDQRADRGRDALPTRKVIGPPTDGFTRPAGTLPGFFWLPVQCDQAPSGSLIPAIELMWPSLRAHARYVAEAWRQEAGLGERAKRVIADHLPGEVIDLGKGASLEALAKLLDSFGLVVPFPGVGWIVEQAGRGISQGRERWRVKRDVAAGGDLDPGLSPPATLAGELLRMPLPGLPLVVVVEDAHLMDPGLAEALAQLAEPDAKRPVLVIATAWPEGRTRPDYQQWRAALLEAETGAPRARLVAKATQPAFPRLVLADRVRMVLAHASQTDQATAALIAVKWENPYALRLALTSTRMQRRISDDAYVVSADDLDGMPRDIEGLYRDRWDELPGQVKQALTLAAGALPDPAGDGSVWPYATSIVAQAAEASGLIDDPGTVSGALGEAVDPLEWSRQEDRDLDVVSFREWALERIARDAYAADYAGDGNGFLAAVVDDIAERIEQARGDDYLLPDDDPVGLFLARWLLALQPGRADQAAATASLTLAAELISTRPAEAIRLLTQPDRIAALPPVSEWSLYARGILALALLEAGQVHHAIDQYRALLADEVRVLGADHPDTLTTRGNLALALREAGQVQDAIDQYRDLLADQLRVLGEDHPHTLTTRNTLAGALREAGQVQDAVDQYRALLPDMVRVLGEDHPTTLATRNNLALALREAGQVQDAVDQFRDLLADQVLVLGPDHPHTLTTRNNLAFALREAGQVQDAVDQLRALLADRLRVLGADHPDTLDTQRELDAAIARLSSGRGEEALTTTALGLVIPSPGSVGRAERPGPVAAARTPRVVYWSLALGLLGFLGGVSAVVGLPLGIVGRRRAKRAGAGVGKATAAIVLSSAWLVVAAAVLMTAGVMARPAVGGDGAGAARACSVLRGGYDSARRVLPASVPSFEEAVGRVDGVLARFNLGLRGCEVALGTAGLAVLPQVVD